MVITPAGASRCQCAKERARAAFYSQIPPEFRVTTLAEAVPDPKRHPKQEAYLKMLRDRPFESYLFFGANGTGKSFLAWLIAMNAYEAQRRVLTADLDRLLKQYRAYEFNNAERPVVVADDLVPGPPSVDLLRKDWTVGEVIDVPQTKTTIFLDEISATTPTEYAAKEFFHLLKAAHEFEHQVVMTCNVTPEELQHHWCRTDAFWGNSIARRIAEYMTLIDLTR